MLYSPFNNDSLNLYPKEPLYKNIPHYISYFVTKYKNPIIITSIIAASIITTVGYLYWRYKHIHEQDVDAEQKHIVGNLIYDTESHVISDAEIDKYNVDFAKLCKVMQRNAMSLSTR